MLDAPVLFEVEDRAPEVVAKPEIEGGDDHLVVLAEGAGGNLAGRRDDHRTADQTITILLTGFGRGEDPSSVLIGVRLHRDQVMEHAQVYGLGMLDVLGWRVVAERHYLDSLQAHDTERLRPAPVVADTHTDDGIEDTPHLEAVVADLEVAFFEMLKGRVR